MWACFGMKCKLLSSCPFSKLFFLLFHYILLSALSIDSWFPWIRNQWTLAPACLNRFHQYHHSQEFYQPRHPLTQTCMGLASCLFLQEGDGGYVVQRLAASAISPSTSLLRPSFLFPEISIFPSHPCTMPSFVSSAWMFCSSHDHVCGLQHLIIRDW